MSNGTATNRAGTSWQEIFLDGSKEAEDELIRRRFAPEINRIQRDIRRIESNQHIERAQHARLRASTKNAEFRVLPDIPEDLRVGILQPGKEYQAHVRFSNASSIVQPDLSRDLRGLAIRVKAGTGNDHDLLMTNAPYSHVPRARCKAIRGHSLLVRPPVYPAVLWKSRGWRTLAALVRIARRLGLKETLRVFRTLREQTSRPVASLATETFWSRAPYAFGNVALMFKLVPEERSSEGRADDLRAELISRLKQGEVRFDFKVQRYVDDDKTPIEDGTVEWKEEVAPSTTIAQLVIPGQELNPADEQEIEGYTFNPWNTSSTDIRPLRSTNRARKLVYYASARLRKEA